MTTTFRLFNSEKISSHHRITFGVPVKTIDLAKTLSHVRICLMTHIPVVDPMSISVNGGWLPFSRKAVITVGKFGRQFPIST
jgi:hypothetical protein